MLLIVFSWNEGNMDVEWKAVVGFEEYFKVSNFGEVFSLRSGKILKQHTKRNGYKQ
jgi:hypothetical protein